MFFFLLRLSVHVYNCLKNHELLSKDQNIDIPVYRWNQRHKQNTFVEKTEGFNILVIVIGLRL